MKRDPLGTNPLSQGIYTKTSHEEPGTRNQEPATRNQEPGTINHKPGNRNHKLGTRKQRKEIAVLQDGDKEKITLDLAVDLNEWLDHLVRHGKKKHGHKIPKQKWIQAALEIMQSMPVEWEKIETLEAFREEVQKIVDKNLRKQQNQEDQEQETSF